MVRCAEVVKNTAPSAEKQTGEWGKPGKEGGREEVIKSIRILSYVSTSTRFCVLICQCFSKKSGSFI